MNTASVLFPSKAKHPWLYLGLPVGFFLARKLLVLFLQ